jgi:hypothetical protein
MLPDTLVIIPAFNEEATVGNVIEDVRAHLSGADIVVVDDGSTDATSERALALGAVVLRLPMNLGIGGAVQTGFMYAARHRYAYAIQIDADGQHPAAEAARLIEAMRAGKADVVIGSRFLGHDRDRSDPYTLRGGSQVPRGREADRGAQMINGRASRSSSTRRIGIRLLGFVNRITSGVSIHDCTSGFRVYNRRAFMFLSECYPSDYPEVEAITMLASNGFRLAEVPVTMRDRQGGTSSITFPHAFYYMIKVSMAACISRFRARR